MFKVSKTLITMAVSFGRGIDDWNQCAPPDATHSDTKRHIPGHKSQKHNLN